MAGGFLDASLAAKGVAVRLVPFEHAPRPEPGFFTVPDYRPDQRRRPALGLADGHPVGSARHVAGSRSPADAPDEEDEVTVEP